ncbi:MAG: PilZ domain-containing protein [Candidatus Omnitrophota bacterium]|nr:PilZ domain-containing protein [Candidatus Omnitrophota bacterium]
MTHKGQERRKHPRIGGRFIVSYRILEGDGDTKTKRDITQTKNISLGGMLLTTNMQFKPGTNLALEIRLPFDPNPIMLIARVIESRQIIENLVYDTRLMFLAVDEQHRPIIEKTIQYYTKKEG